ncbi:MAG: hypothetical protein J4G18_17875 [Anaerolineae bacterium]|nr:hypothetical protein [Anaerolineae bacterium]
MNYQVLAMKVCSMSARLHLEIGEEDVALDRVTKCVSEQENYTRKFVNKSLGDNPALYFHESVSDENLERYLDIERWMRGKPDILSDVIKAYRRSFWEDDAIKALFTRGRVTAQLLDDPFYLQSLPQAEILIENFQRLKGYELELSSMCLPTFAEWESYDGDGSLSISEHDGYVMLVNHALLDSKIAASQ